MNEKIEIKNRFNIVNAGFNGFVTDRFEAVPGQVWCILGSNRSGIDDFFRLMSEDGLDFQAEGFELPENTGVVSFKNQQDIYEKELKNDETDFLDRIDPGTPAGSFLTDPDHHTGLIRAFAMDRVLDKGYRQLSTGQSRKLMILSRITAGASCMIIQSPFEGLDPIACRELDSALFHLHEKGILLILFVNNLSDIPDWSTHAALISDRQMICRGEKDAVMDKIETALKTARPDFRASAQTLKNFPDNNLGAGSHKSPAASETEPNTLVCLKNGSAGYEGTPVFTGLDLEIRTGEHTLISGPNGCGKSTLIQVIIGEHPACYQNDLKIFGRQRGTGESIWDLKQHMGIVSAELHRNYIVPGSVLHCVISGLFDSIGVYRKYGVQDEKKAAQWLERLNMTHERDTSFRSLSFAGQRLILIARALIKLPRLLILDEPTQGLDERNRHAVLDFLEDAAKEQLTTILYVSHRRDEFRSFFKQHIKMEAL